MPINPVTKMIADTVAGFQSGLNPSDIEPLVTTPPRPDLGDYAIPVFKFAKTLSIKPDILAESWVSKLRDAGLVASREGAFVNITLPARILTTFVREFWSTNGTRIPPARVGRVMIEYSQPNTHKELHVGHVRNMCLGDCLRRLYQNLLPADVMAVNYYGDEGAHIAKCLWYIDHAKLEMKEDGAWLGAQYVAATKYLAEVSLENLRKYETEISAVLRSIETKSDPWFSRWQLTRSWSLKMFREFYHWLDIHFDHDFFESELTDMSQWMVDEYLQRGAFVLDDGAIGCDLSEQKLGFLLLRKRDGNTLYATKDLALMRRKYEEFAVEHSIYVVAQEQKHHFMQVFACMKKLGFSRANDCFHLAYGHVRLPTGKMSSREGNTFTAANLRAIVEDAISPHLEKYKGVWSEGDILKVKAQLAVGSIRFGMLATDPMKEVIFTPEEWTSFEGFSGPYLMYTFARLHSICRVNFDRAEHMSDETLESFKTLFHSAGQFWNVVAEATESFRPSSLLHYLYQLAKEMNRLYVQLPFAKEVDLRKRSERLTLLSEILAIYGAGLTLLGIPTPERM